MIVFQGLQSQLPHPTVDSRPVQRCDRCVGVDVPGPGRAPGQRLRGVLGAVLALLVVALLPVPWPEDCAGPGTAGAACSRPADGSGPTSRRGFWYAIGDEPSGAEVDAAAARYGVVVLNPWDTWALHRIKRVDPSVVVLAYKDLSSTRSYHHGPTPPTGVGADEAASHPEWFARASDGERIEWDPYPRHWQMAVWDDAYQERWVDNVVHEVVRAGWDGVLADNDLATLRWYDAALLEGTTSTDDTDARLREGLDALVARAGDALRAHGKVLVPNVSDARLHPGRWAVHAVNGGAMEENLGHWGTDPAAGFVSDWGASGWVTQTEQLASPGMTLAVTRADRGDRRSLLYGFASVLVRGDEDAFWMPSTTAAGTYTEPEALPEMSIELGEPLTEGVRGPGGVWTRTFARGWVAVNPTESTVRLPAPPGTEDADGERMAAVDLPPTSGTVLRRQV